MAFRFDPARRHFLRSAVAASTLFPAIVESLAAEDRTDPLAPKPPHFPAKAKRVIFLFMSGGVSHVDTFDPKPKLTADHGKQVKLDHPETRNRPGYEKLFLKKPQWEFKPRKERHGNQRTVPASRHPCGRHRPDPLDAHRPLEPLQRHARHAHGVVHCRAGPGSALG